MSAPYSDSIQRIYGPDSNSGAISTSRGRRKNDDGRKSREHRSSPSESQETYVTMTAGRELGIMVPTPLVLGVPTVYAPIPVARRIPGRCAGSTRSRACPTLVLAPGQALIITGSVYTVASGLSVSFLSLNHEAAAVNEFLSYHLSHHVCDVPDLR